MTNRDRGVLIGLQTWGGSALDTDTREVTHEQSRLITASLREVWGLHADVEAWPTWNSDVVAVTLSGPMATGGTISVTTSDGGRTVRIYALVENELTFWGDVVDDGSRWLQTWAFERTARGTQIAVTTSVIGSDAAASAALAAGLRAAAETQLESLQLCAERPDALGA
jgi:hypothetical protein